MTDTHKEQRICSYCSRQGDASTIAQLVRTKAQGCAPLHEVRYVCHPCWELGIDGPSEAQPPVAALQVTMSAVRAQMAEIQQRLARIEQPVREWQEFQAGIKCGLVGRYPRNLKS